MNKRLSISILFFSATVIVLTFIQIVYLQTRNTHTIEKRLLVKKTALPDLALSTEAHFIRHRSLSDLFSIFSNAPMLLEYFPSTFVYHYSGVVQKKNPARIELEK